MSGADLIGKVPAHWRLKPLRLIGRLLKGTGGSKEDVVENGVPCVRYGDLYTTHNNFIERARTYLTEHRAQDYTPIEYGDVLFAASGETIEEIGKSAVNLLHDARCGGDVVIFRPSEPSIARFFGYAMDAAPVAAQKSLAGRGTTVMHIYPDELREVIVAVPPVGEQQVIADYLDRETARLDALVAAKERVLSLLAEKRRALITRAVTRGLDPCAPLRDSGIPWLGEIPAHWRIERLKFHLRWIEQGWSPICDSMPATLEEWGVLKAGCVNGWDFDPTENKRLPDDTAPMPQYEVRRGDVLMSRANTTALLGSTALVGEVRPRLLLCDKLYRLGVDDDTLNRQYLVVLLRSPAGRCEFERDATGASNSMQNIGQDSVRNLWLTVPPIDEQRTIVGHIAAASVKLEAMRTATEHTVRLLKERRAALIAAAVMGQIDIRLVLSSKSAGSSSGLNWQQAATPEENG